MDCIFHTFLVVYSSVPIESLRHNNDEYKKFIGEENIFYFSQSFKYLLIFFFLFFLYRLVNAHDIKIVLSVKYDSFSHSTHFPALRKFVRDNAISDVKKKKSFSFLRIFIIITCTHISPQRRSICCLPATGGNTATKQK